MKLAGLTGYLESVVPLSFQESYDNTGIQVGDFEKDVESVLLSLDITEEVVDEAAENRCDLIISHHPLIFKPLRSVSDNTVTGRIIRKLIEKDICVYSMHTNLDIIKGGVSYRMAEKAGLSGVYPMVPLTGKLLKLVVFVPGDHAPKLRDAVFNAGAGYIGNYDRCSYNVSGEGTFRAGPGTHPYKGKQGVEHTEAEIRIETVFPEYLKNNVVRAMIDAHPYEEVAYDLYSLENEIPGAGLGCVGELDEPVRDSEFIEYISGIFEAKGIRHSGLTGNMIKKIAMMGGSGGAYVDRARLAGADAYITADIKYHSFFDAGKSLLLADIGHYESEKPALEVIHELIIKKFPKFAIRFSEISTNPVNYLQAWKK